MKAKSWNQPIHMSKVQTNKKPKKKTKKLYDKSINENVEYRMSKSDKSNHEDQKTKNKEEQLKMKIIFFSSM